MPELYSDHPIHVKKHTPSRAIPAPESGSQTRITCEPIVATASCLDTLKISLWVDWNCSDLLERLQQAKDIAQQGENPSEPVDLAGYTWNVMRSGTSNFNYRLVRGDIKVLINRREAFTSFATTRIEIGSASCWSPGYRTVYEELIQIVELYGGVIVKEIISEVHLTTDFIGQDIRLLPIANQDHWITRAHDFAPHYSRKELTGISVGKGNFMLRIYDKVGELKKHSDKQQLFKDVWGVPVFDEKPVSRIEFQIRRPVLKEFVPIINNLVDLENCLDSLWHYCCGNWCRFTSESVDRNHHQSRAENHPFWDMALNVDWVSAIKIRREKRYVQKDQNRILKQARGLCMSLCATQEREPEDLEGVVILSQMELEKELRRLYKEEREKFVKLMNKKINESVPFRKISEAEREAKKAARISFDFGMEGLK